MANPVSETGRSPLMPSLSRSAEGMALQAKFVEIISKNIANAQTTRTSDGTPYQREVGVAATDAETGEVTAQVVTDDSPGRQVYDPGNPDAGADGFVQYPNVDVSTELVDLMVARRLHEANAIVFQAAKSMLKRALEI
jgi:flagellar basal-body rod protein FlgC